MVKTLTPILRLAKKTVHDYGNPEGAVCLAAAVVRYMHLSPTSSLSDGLCY